MPVILQKFIYRADLRANQDVLYVFGDNLKRVGLGGQAKEMRGEHNAVGVATKRAPGHEHHDDYSRSDYFSDNNYISQMHQIDIDFEPVFNHLRKGGTVVIPMAGLGTGRSKLDEYAPRTAKYIEGIINKIRRG